MWAAGPDHTVRSPGQWPAPVTGQPQTARMVLADEADSQPTAARNFTRTVLNRWALSADAEDVTLAVSELVTNAPLHGPANLKHIPTAGINSC